MQAEVADDHDQVDLRLEHRDCDRAAAHHMFILDGTSCAGTVFKRNDSIMVMVYKLDTKNFAKAPKMLAHIIDT